MDTSPTPAPAPGGGDAASAALAALRASFSEVQCNRRSGVYILLHRNEIVYIGASRHIEQRIVLHGSERRFGILDEASAAARADRRLYRRAR